MPKKKPIYMINGERYEALWEKIPREHRDDWTIALLRTHLQPWEFNFIIACMHDGVTGNGGQIHGFCCVYEDLEATISAWSEIGAVKIARCLSLLRERALALGCVRDDGSLPPDYGLSEAHFDELEAYCDSLPYEDDLDVNRLLDAYWNQKANNLWMSTAHNNSISFHSHRNEAVTSHLTLCRM